MPGPNTPYVPDKFLSQLVHRIAQNRLDKSCGAEWLSDEQLDAIATRELGIPLPDHLNKCLPCLDAYAKAIKRLEEKRWTSS